MPLLRPRVVYPFQVTRKKGARAAPEEQAPDNYVSQLIKYIPAETITAYQGVSGLVAGSPELANRWLAVTGYLCLAFTPIWIYFATKTENEPPAWSQAIVSFLSFAVWLVAVNSPAARYFLPEGWNELQGSIVLIIATVLVFPLLGRVLARYLQG